MEMVSKRNDKLEAMLNTDPFLNKVDIIAVRIKS